MITENKTQNENEMIDSYKGEYYDLFKSIFDDAKNGICIVDYDGKIVELNNLYADMFGYDKRELINKHFSNLIAEESYNTVKNNHYKIFNGTTILKAEEKVKHKNGTHFYIQTSNLRVNDENGKKLRITTAIDITERLKNELVQSVLLKISNLVNLNTPLEYLFRHVHKAINNLIPIKNLIVCINDPITNTIEIPYKTSENSNEDLNTITAEHNWISKVGKTLILTEDLISDLIARGKLEKYDNPPKTIIGVPLVIQNNVLGTLIFKDFTTQEFKKADKDILELIASQVSRVVERKNYEREILFAKKQAEDAAQIKSEFLAQISHEIRTPLNSILSFSSLLKNELEDSLSPELKETFNYIERGGNRLTRTIDLILNASKSQNNQYKIKLEEVELEEEVLYPLVKEFENKAAEKDLKIIFEKSTSPIRLVCDQYSLSQLFSNLIENAIKYTSKGSITIKVFYNDLGKLQIDVVDTGIGIADEYISTIFEPFSQEEQGYTRSYEGIGLGLSLVKNYAELNNAEVSVKSKKGEGSKFSVIFN